MYTLLTFVLADVVSVIGPIVLVDSNCVVAVVYANSCTPVAVSSVKEIR